MGLKIRNVGVELGGTTILHDITLRADEGTLIGVLGPSGSGKSTLLHAVSGFRPATSGMVTYGGKDVADHFEELKHSIGFVPQDDIVPTSLKVERVLGYAAELRLADIEPDARKARVNEVMRTLGLTERKDLRVSKLSGGQRKRVSVGVELLVEPDFLFADEPTSGLDPALERALMETFKSLAGEGCTCFVTTHIMTSLDVLDMVCVLHQGHLAFYGPTEDMKVYFEVEDSIDIYAALQKGKGSAWHKRYRASTHAKRFT